MGKLLHQEITEKIIKCTYQVYGALGYGFMEKVYENGMVIDLKEEELKVGQQVPIQVLYKGKVVGDFVADLVVEDKVIVECKAISRLDMIHEVQLVNYLKATDIEVGLLINFGRKLEIKRRIFTKDTEGRDLTPRKI